MARCISSLCVLQAGQRQGEARWQLFITLCQSAAVPPPEDRWALPHALQEVSVPVVGELGVSVDRHRPVIACSPRVHHTPPCTRENGLSRCRAVGTSPDTARHRRSRLSLATSRMYSALAAAMPLAKPSPAPMAASSMSAARRSSSSACWGFQQPPV